MSEVFLRVRRASDGWIVTELPDSLDCDDSGVSHIATDSEEATKVFGGILARLEGGGQNSGDRAKKAEGAARP